MAGFDPQIIFGGGQPTLTQAPYTGRGGGGGLAAGNVQPHHGLIGMVLLATLVIFVLDKAGYRFFVTAGKR